MVERPLTIAWISHFPVEWLPNAPEAVRHLPKLHPAPWQRVLLAELKTVPGLKLHVFAVRKYFERSLRFDLDGVTFHCVKVPGGIRTASLFWWETWLIRRAVRSIQPDLVHAWGTERGAALVASRLKRPYMVTMQGLLQWCQEKVNLGRFVELEARLEDTSLKRSRWVTAESRFANNWLRERYPHLDITQVEHAPNPLFHELKRAPAQEPVQFLFVGAISKLKGSDLLLAALEQLSGEIDFRLSIIGTGRPEFISSLKHQTSSRLWERITFRRGLSQEEVADEVARSTLMLFPTRADNSPNSVKEAVVAGLPVVASAVGGILDYVVDNRNGFTFPAGNLAAFVAAIRSAMAHPLFSKGQVENETLRRMREYLSPRLMKEKFLAAYGRAVSCKKV